MKTCKLIAAVACGVIFSTSQAAAAPLTFSKLANFRFELTDLTPDDGVAANIEWIGPIFNLADNSFSGLDGAAYLQDYAFDNAPQHRTTLTPAGKAVADANGYSLSTEIELLSDQIVSQAVFSQGFILGPNTRVTFSVDWLAQSAYDWPLLGSVGSHLYVSSGLAGGLSIVKKEISFEFPGLFEDRLTLAYESGQSARLGDVSGAVVSTAQNVSPWSPDATVPAPGSAVLLLTGAVAAAVIRRRRICAP